jgi:hypothetical protein
LKIYFWGSHDDKLEQQTGLMLRFSVEPHNFKLCAKRMLRAVRSAQNYRLHANSIPSGDVKSGEGI